MENLPKKLKNKKKSLKKLLEPISKDLAIEELEKTSLEIHIEDFNNSISKLEEDLESKKLLEEEIKEAKKSITRAQTRLFYR